MNTIHKALVCTLILISQFVICQTAHAAASIFLGTSVQPQTQPLQLANGDTLAYQVSVQNHGPDPAENIVLKAQYFNIAPAALPSNCQADSTGSSITCQLGTLAVNNNGGEILSLAFTVAGKVGTTASANFSITSSTTLAADSVTLSAGRSATIVAMHTPLAVPAMPKWAVFALGSALVVITIRKALKARPSRDLG